MNLNQLCVKLSNIKKQNTQDVQLQCKKINWLQEAPVAYQSLCNLSRLK